MSKRPEDESEILRLIKAILRAPRDFAPQSPTGSTASMGRIPPARPFAAVCDAVAGKISP
jgi:hypothetical protein